MSRHPRRRRFDDEFDEFDDFVDVDEFAEFDKFTEFDKAIVPAVRPDPTDQTHLTDHGGDPPDEPIWSNYHEPGVLHGPQPVPAWVITSPGAVDTDLGVLKSGKEADVSLLVRCDGDRVNRLAVKRYRTAEHRMFHRDATYLEGRRERKSRERRAMATRTGFGRELIAGRWAQAEFQVLARLWSVGASVPYPVQLAGTALMMEFVGDDDGVAAPRLAQLRPDPDEAADWYAQLRTVLVRLAEAGFAHGDLSPYNVLVHRGRVVVIDVPQAVDLVGNPLAEDFVRRDCENAVAWFRARGVDVRAVELADELLSIGRGAVP